MTEIETALTSSLGLDVPLVQAPIGSATCPALASAVANAGGLGMLALTWRTPTAVGLRLRSCSVRPVRG